MDNLPLTDIRVLELGHIVAAPSGSLLLAELGADVIKVESTTGGDQARNFPPVFYFYNRNKRSITIDLKASAGKDLFLLLMQKSDVIIDNYAPGVLDRLGISYEVARKINPGVIYCAIKGFTNGPYEDRPLLDDLAQMMSGLAYMTGPPGQPLKAGGSIVDIGAGTYGVIGILAALHARTSTGQGQHIRSGLFETATFWMGQSITMAGMTGRTPMPLPVAGGNRAWGVYELFNSSDERQIFIAVTSNNHWERFCKEFDLLDLYEDDSLNTNAKRASQREHTIPRIREVVGKCPQNELMERLDRCKVPYAPVNTPADLLEDPHLNTGDHLLEISVQDDKKYKIPAIPMHSSSFSYSIRLNPPELGQHTKEILNETGLSATEIQQLIDDGVVTI